MTSFCRAAGKVEPQPELMLRPSGRSWPATTSSPRPRNRAGASADAAPLAQSTASRRLLPAAVPAPLGPEQEIQRTPVDPGDGARPRGAWRAGFPGRETGADPVFQEGG